MSGLVSYWKKEFHDPVPNRNGRTCTGDGTGDCDGDGDGEVGGIGGFGCKPCGGPIASATAAASLAVAVTRSSRLRTSRRFAYLVINIVTS